MSLIDTSTLEKLGDFLDLAVFRQTLIASNLANVDTPGYRTRDVDFEGEMQRAEGQASSDPLKPRAIEVAGLMERPDGNNVSLDRESMLLARTQLQFRLGVELLRQEFQTISTAIKEGS
jgi:flagellar basal-body rod protein FlgB